MATLEGQYGQSEIMWKIEYGRNYSRLRKVLDERREAMKKTESFHTCDQTYAVTGDRILLKKEVRTRVPL